MLFRRILNRSVVRVAILDGTVSTPVSFWATRVHRAARPVAVASLAALLVERGGPAAPLRLHYYILHCSAMPTNMHSTAALWRVGDAWRHMPLRCLATLPLYMPHRLLRLLPLPRTSLTYLTYAAFACFWTACSASVAYMLLF